MGMQPKPCMRVSPKLAGGVHAVTRRVLGSPAQEESGAPQGGQAEAAEKAEQAANDAGDAAAAAAAARAADEEEEEDVVNSSRQDVSWVSTPTEQLLHVRLHAGHPDVTPRVVCTGVAMMPVFML